MTKIINDLRSKAKTGDYLNERHDCVKIDIGGNPLTILSRDADTPEELVKFLSKYKNLLGNKAPKDT